MATHELSLPASLWSHPVFENPQERHAFCELFFSVVSEECEVRQGQRVVHLKPGEAAVSGRRIADAVNWSRRQFDVFLKRLQKAKIIELMRHSGITVLRLIGFGQPEPQPQQHDDACADDAETICVEVSKIVPPREGRSWEPDIAERWLEAGYDIERDVIPAVQRVKSRMNGTKPTSLRYFEDEVRRCHDRRTRDHKASARRATREAPDHGPGDDVGHKARAASAAAGQERRRAYLAELDKLLSGLSGRG